MRTAGCGFSAVPCVRDGPAADTQACASRMTEAAPSSAAARSAWTRSSTRSRRALWDSRAQGLWELSAQQRPGPPRAARALRDLQSA
eukprot:14334078-Alexandrium_andersonii.AAC.1